MRRLCGKMVALGSSCRVRAMLFDTVAVYLAFSEELLVMEDLPIRVTDDGCTVVDENAKRLHVAVD